MWKILDNNFLIRYYQYKTAPLASAKNSIHFTYTPIIAHWHSLYQPKILSTDLKNKAESYREKKKRKKKGCGHDNQKTKAVW